MVMKHNGMRKNLSRTIRASLGRYIAIVAIIALGCGIFVGLRVTKTDMVATGQKYTDEQNMFDLRLLNTYGWSREDVDAIARMDGIADAEGTVTLDAFARFGDGAEDRVYRLHSLPERVDRVRLLAGRMPQSPDECLVDGARAKKDVIGTRVVISDANDADTLDSLNCHTFTVVGYVSTPLYMDTTRGTTTLGSGSLSSYIYLPQEAFAVDYVTEIHVTIPGDWAIYSGEYNDALNENADRLKLAITPLAHNRFLNVKQEAEQAYADGMRDFNDGQKAYTEAEEKLRLELADALKKLEDAQAEINENRQALADGESQLSDAQKLLDENAQQLAQSRLELENTKAETYAQLAQANKELLENYKTVNESLKQVKDGLAQIESGLKQVEDGLKQIDDAMPLLELAISLQEIQVQTTQRSLEAAKLTGNEELISYLENRLAEQTAKLEEYYTQKTEAEATRQELEAKKAELEAKKAELESTQVTLEDALETINEGFVELDSNQAQADRQFAAASARIEAGALELEGAQKELDGKKAELEEGKQALADGEAELAKGRADYETGKAEAEAELAKSRAELDDAEEELAEARQNIDEMEEPDVFALTRNTNAGYVALDSNSDIVSGVSRVFPAFFLLVAALVCITTMTRMVEEERTEIGTMKALGYGNYAIIRKYLLYSGSAAVIGCGLGVVAGSIVFPWILWKAYCIIFNITPGVVLLFDWPLCIAVVLVYTAVSTLVTWYCCRRTLREVPAELIRPKAPTAGKKIFLEYLPFWNRMGFLNKVMLRNVFRYRQRLMMMLVGVGGCTALLLTGFGFRNTVSDIVNIQFEEVSRYDMQVFFSEGQTEQMQQSFRKALESDDQDVGFFYQSSVELEHNDQSRSIYLIAGDSSVKTFLDFHCGGESMDMPGTGEAFLTAGIADLAGISVGDTVTVRTTDMETLTVRISGIYDNHVYNYMIVTPQTVAEQWGEMPEYQTAFVNVREGRDVHTVSAAIGGMKDVMNINVSQDQAEMVNSMMKALDLVVITIVICAGLLAAIVVYNLTNISITERIREIATIKVLGFNAGETSAYVFKENILLSVFGAGLGLIGGKFLLDFVISQIKIDMVWFQPRLSVGSHLYAILLTLAAVAAVDFIFHFRLDKINMAEALKSVE